MGHDDLVIIGRVTGARDRRQIVGEDPRHGRQVASGVAHRTDNGDRGGLPLSETVQIACLKRGSTRQKMTTQAVAERKISVSRNRNTTRTVP
jgi:hypothetical protein